MLLIIQQKITVSRTDTIYREVYNINFMRIRIGLLLLLLAVTVAFDGPLADLVTGLPLPGVDVSWWSGKNYD